MQRVAFKLQYEAWGWCTSPNNEYSGWYISIKSFKLAHPCSILFVTKSVTSSRTSGGACVQIIFESFNFDSFFENVSSSISPLAFIGVGTPPPA